MIDESVFPPTPRQVLQYDLYEAIVSSYGQFDQSSGSEGAHYAPENPFSAQGIKRSNCFFFRGGNACELVSGEINPEAVCKLWIIPNQLITEGN